MSSIVTCSTRAQGMRRGRSLAYGGPDGAQALIDRELHPQSGLRRVAYAPS
jgi:hypothetical protein